MNPTLSPRWLALALVMVTAALFWPGLSGDFLFDDFPNIVANTRVQPQQLDLDSLATAAGGYSGMIGRPLATISFALDYLSSGRDPWGYKLTSLGVHLVNTVLVFWLVRRLLVVAAGRTPLPASDLAAALVALAWAAHPIQVSSVLYIVQRMETLAVTFLLLGFLAYLRGRLLQIAGGTGWPWLVGSGLLAGIALLSKETAVLFPAFTLALELTLLGFGAAEARTRRLLGWAYGLLVGAAVLAFVFWALPMNLQDGAFFKRDFTAVERVLTQLRVLPMYLGWMLLPLPDFLVFYRDDFEVSRSLLQPATTLWGGLLLVALAALALAARRRRPLLALGLMWFFVAHLITSNVFSLELVFEHRNYLALLGVLLAVADLLAPALRRAMPARAVLAAALVLVSALTLMRAATWGDPFQLAMDLTERNPKSQRASNDLATLYASLADGNARSPWYAKAMAEYARGAALPRSSPLSEQGLILLAASSGQPVQDAWWDSLVAKLRDNPVGAQERSALSNLVRQRDAGLALDDRRLAEAYGALIERQGLPPDMYVQFANHALDKLGDPELADRGYDMAIRQSGRDPEYLARLITGMVTRGELAQAQRLLARAEHLGALDVGSIVISIGDAPEASVDP